MESESTLPMLPQMPAEYSRNKTWTKIAQLAALLLMGVLVVTVMVALLSQGSVQRIAMFSLIIAGVLSIADLRFFVVLAHQAQMLRIGYADTLYSWSIAIDDNVLADFPKFEPMLSDQRDWTHTDEEILLGWLSKILAALSNEH